MNLNTIYKNAVAIFLISGIGFAVISCNPSKKNAVVLESRSIDTIQLISSENSCNLILNFERGKSHNHPTFALWLADANGRYIETLFVTRSIGQGVFNYGDKTGDQWKPGAVRRPAALPVWSHARGIKAADGLYIPDEGTRLPDAVSGATPKGSFELIAGSNLKAGETYKLRFEINQTWDWNNFWTNNKYPDDINYKTSCQPSLVYEAEFKAGKNPEALELKPYGIGHYSGKDGEIYPDINTLTTATAIASSIKVKILCK
jgi:hypothetical protein